MKYNIKISMGDTMNRKLVGLIIGIILAGSALPAVGVSYNKNTSTNIYVDNTNVVQSIGNDDDWSMFHHDLAHTGFTSSVAPNTNNTFWNSTAGAGSCPFDSLIMPSPTIVDGKVYVGAHWENKLYCFDALDGTELWNFTAGSYVFSTPAVTNGRVYFGSFDRKIYCLDAETGDFIWNFSASNLAWSSPAVVNDRVYVAGGMDVFCLNATGNGDGTTTKIWQYATDGVVYSSPAVVDDRVYIGSNDHRVYCLDAEGSGDGTTTEHWNYTTDGSVWSSPAVENGYVYIGSHDTNLYCLNTETGIPEWIYPTDFAIMASPAIAYGKIYIASMNGNVYCVDSLTGFPEWEKQIGTDIGSSPAVANDKAYIGETLIGVFCLDASDGTIFWNYTTEPYAGCDSSPAIVDGILYIASYDGNLYAFKDLNSPPSKPSVSGPSAAAPGFDLNFTAVSIDLDGDEYPHISYSDYGVMGTTQVGLDHFPLVKTFQ